MNRNNELTAISQKVIQLMKDSAWLEDADTFVFPVSALQPKPQPERTEEGVRE